MDHVTDRMIRRKEIIERLGINQSTLYRWCQNGNFPKAIQIGPNSVAWLRSDFNKWLKQRIKNR